MVPFKCEVSAMTDLVANLKSLGGHPPVEELCWCVTERYDRLVSSLDKLCAATQTCYQVVHEFERGEGVQTKRSWLGIRETLTCLEGQHQHGTPRLYRLTMQD